LGGIHFLGTLGNLKLIFVSKNWFEVATVGYLLMFFENWSILENKLNEYFETIHFTLKIPPDVIKTKYREDFSFISLNDQDNYKMCPGNMYFVIEGEMTIFDNKISENAKEETAVFSKGQVSKYDGVPNPIGQAPKSPSRKESSIQAISKEISQILLSIANTPVRSKFDLSNSHSEAEDRDVINNSPIKTLVQTRLVPSPEPDDLCLDDDEALDYHDDSGMVESQVVGSNRNIYSGKMIPTRVIVLKVGDGPGKTEVVKKMMEPSPETFNISAANQHRIVCNDFVTEIYVLSGNYFVMPDRRPTKKDKGSGFYRAKASGAGVTVDVCSVDLDTIMMKMKAVRAETKEQMLLCNYVIDNLFFFKEISNTMKNDKFRYNLDSLQILKGEHIILPNQQIES
jgi:hypothetical protein